MITNSMSTTITGINKYNEYLKAFGNTEIILDQDTDYQLPQGETVDVEEKVKQVLNDFYSYENSMNVTIPLESILYWILPERILIPQADEVRNYLLSNPDLFYILPSVCNELAQRFGWETQLSLELYQDPEIDDEYLTIYVRTDNYNKKIFKNIKEVRSKYGEILSGISGWLLITTDFQPPL